MSSLELQYIVDLHIRLPSEASGLATYELSIHDVPLD
jgi:hypothetical protein